MAKLRKITQDELQEILAEHKKWLESDKKEGKSANLSLADLTGADLNGANLSETNLNDAVLRGANLTNTYLVGATLRSAILVKADLIKTNLSGADLHKANFHKADLTEANLNKAILTEADLTAAILDRANLTGADLNGANLCKAYLREAKLIRADLRNVELTNGDLRKAYLREARLSRANLSRTNLSGANLSEANLHGADLTEADLSEANLDRANLSKAKLNRADLTEAKLNRADLTETEFIVAELTEAKLNRADLTEAKLNGANLTNADLREADLTYTQFDNTTVAGCFFLRSKISKAILINVIWNNSKELGQSESKFFRHTRRIVYDEVKANNKVDYEYVGDIYRQLKINYENKRDFVEAGDFGYGQMEMKRKSMTGFTRISCTFYKWFSGYGEMPGLAAMWLLVFLLLFPFAYMFNGITPRQDTSQLEKIQYDISLSLPNWQSICDFRYPVIHTLQVATLQKDKAYKSYDFWGWLLEVFEVILFPIQITLLVLAVKRKFKR